MAGTPLATGPLSLPNHLLPGVWQKVQTGSVVAALCGETPQLFGVNQKLVLTAPPKAQFVGQGAAKNSSTATFAPKTANPEKAQVTVRVNEEFLWADADYKTNVMQDAVVPALAIALARALDLGAIHQMNPLDGTVYAGITDYLKAATTQITATAGKPDLDVEAGMGALIASGFFPTGLAVDTAYAMSIKTERDTLGRKLYPDFQIKPNQLTEFEGLPTAIGNTMSGTLEGAVSGGMYASTNPNYKALVGDFRAFMWGIQRQVPIELIPFGDPDGGGDLKRNNQVALRAEIVFGWTIFDLAAFAIVKQ